MEPGHGAGAARTRTRRGFLLGSGIVVAAAAGGGVALGLSTSSGHEGHDDPFIAHVPAELIAARDAESALLATLDATIAGARPATVRLLRAIRADHAAHVAAIRSSIATAAYPATVPRPSSTPASGRPASGPALRAAESRAARAAAARAARLTGAPAALLASIAASEAAHAELLS